MRRSKNGKELYFLWEGQKNVNDIRLIETQSTLQLNDELNEKIESEWNRIAEKNPNVWDAPKWRTEFVHEDSELLCIYVSPISYSQHNVMRHITGQPMQFYPNPITVNTVQETADGYILIGVKGKGSDQKGLGLVGSGFVERYADKEGVSKKPESLGFVVQKECLQETVYNKKKDFYMDDASAMAVIFGSSHDTTVGFYLPLFATHDEVDISNNEHDDLLLLPTNNDDIFDVLNQGSYKGITASDHLLGCLESYVRLKSKEQ